MLITEKLPPRHIYPQITQVPISYAEFLNHFRGGHTIDDNLNATSIASSLQAALIQVALLGGHITKTKNMAMPNEFLADVTLTKAGLELIQTVHWIDNFAKWRSLKRKRASPRTINVCISRRGHCQRR
jgi:hypothetical protein